MNTPAPSVMLSSLPPEPGEQLLFHRVDARKPFLGFLGGYHHEYAVSDRRLVYCFDKNTPMIVRLENIEGLDGSVGGSMVIPDIPGDAAILLVPLCMIVLAPFALIAWVYDYFTRRSLSRQDWNYWKNVKKLKIKVRGEFFRTTIAGSIANDLGHAIAGAMASSGRPVLPR